VDRNRRTVADMRAFKAAGAKISMLYVTTTEEAAAADAAGIHMLSIEGRFFTPEVRKAAGSCFVQVGLPYGGWGTFSGPTSRHGGRLTCGPPITSRPWAAIVSTVPPRTTSKRHSATITCRLSRMLA
jgi:hypothetical protein